jgi:hypothetical protein
MHTAAVKRISAKEAFMTRRTLDPDPESTELATGIPIRRYRKMVHRKDQRGIAELVGNRFKERYLNPVLQSRAPHGFAMLAICCLMVEALESFRQGWATTDRKSEVAFCGFFHAHDEFSDLRPVAHEFYRAVRCGILHQAETTGGWRVHRRSGPLLEHNGTVYWVSALEFARRLEDVLETYCTTLETSDWAGPVWANTRRKLQSICKNCGVPNVAALA